MEFQTKLSSFPVLFDKIASAYFIWKKIYLYFSIGNGQPREPALMQGLLRLDISTTTGNSKRERRTKNTAHSSVSCYTWKIISLSSFTARRYASAVSLSSCVRLSVCHKTVLWQNWWWRCSCTPRLCRVKTKPAWLIMIFLLVSF